MLWFDDSVKRRKNEINFKKSKENMPCLRVTDQLHKLKAMLYSTRSMTGVYDIL
jgi:hypothetical protein